MKFSLRSTHKFITHYSITFFKFHGKRETGDILKENGRSVFLVYHGCVHYTMITNLLVCKTKFKFLYSEQHFKPNWHHFSMYIVFDLFCTLFSTGQPLNQTGFAKWNFGEPNNRLGKEHCGVLVLQGKLNDARCFDSFLCFICEYEELPPNTSKCILRYQI